jgi:hypothetical protein
MAMTIEHKSLDKADERRDFPNGHIEVCTIGTTVFGRAVFEAGWRWSESVGPIAGTQSCMINHNGYIESGRLHVRMDDGTEAEMGPGEFFVCPPGHDAWVVGDEACVAFDFSADIAGYATAR